jgi:hypothetical protein
MSPTSSRLPLRQELMLEDHVQVAWLQMPPSPGR